MCYCNPDWFCNWGFAPNPNYFFVLPQKSNQKKSRLRPLRSKRTCHDNLLKGGSTKRVWKYSSKWSSSDRWVPWKRTDNHLINTDIFEWNEHAAAIISKVAAQKEHENIVQSGVPRAGEFHENAQIFNLLISLFSHETNMPRQLFQRRRHKKSMKI